MIKVNSINGYEEVLDIYFVSKEGFVFSTKTNKPLASNDNGRGYKVVSLKLKGQRKWKKAYIHRLVALAYIPNIKNSPEVNHKDENKSNNHYENLEWVTRLENVHYGNAIANMTINKCFKVYVYDYLLNYVGEYIGVSEATRTTLGYVDSRALNNRVKEYFYLSDKLEIKKIIEINKNSKYQTVVVENINTSEKLYFPYNRKAREFFEGKVNVTDAIKKNWLVKKTYKIYELDYNKLIDSPNLQE
ncbi:hypothetical protein CPJCM30710_25540 [Clostridium polyendosporum]|uniref:HNH nuclease domain-containing protein n=1 Tax=Clostridium polyendosporum TaxID=69208 RepID=A0A919S3F1_9CLOT|nr:HNH endonuclease signature motif containing protein [Clostridium polyendosporum]GIM29888.1 hypothetical protein CPJCM30710_25540 [Clostridium polyendosporum]